MLFFFLGSVTVGMPATSLTSSTPSSTSSSRRLKYACARCVRSIWIVFCNSCMAGPLSAKQSRRSSRNTFKSWKNEYWSVARDRSSFQSVILLVALPKSSLTFSNCFWFLEFFDFIDSKDLRTEPCICFGSTGGCCAGGGPNPYGKAPPPDTGGERPEDESIRRPVMSAPGGAAEVPGVAPIAADCKGFRIPFRICSISHRTSSSSSSSLSASCTSTSDPMRSLAFIAGASSGSSMRGRSGAASIPLNRSYLFSLSGM
mmetsp:Transcript_33902/g.54931  ORF Transcript_33902/g.54931 Transcript_33902/m.54931 type:complete len:258 (-) Transcript_33902:600-1373(-)